MSEVCPFHDITDWYYVWGLTISWQNRLTLCLRFDHFMTKQTDTISEAWPFHDKSDWYCVWGLTISCQNRLTLYLELDHFMKKQTDTMSEVSPFHDKTDWFYIWACAFYDKTDWHCVWGFTISWQNRLILCLGLDHFMTKQTDTMYEVGPFHDITDWYYV